MLVEGWRSSCSQHTGRGGVLFRRTCPGGPAELPARSPTQRVRGISVNRTV